jgi:hypothetical protein
MWLGLCFTNSYHVFLVLSFLTSITTVTPVSPSSSSLCLGRAAYTV